MSAKRRKTGDVIPIAAARSRRRPIRKAAPDGAADTFIDFCIAEIARVPMRRFYVKGAVVGSFVKLSCDSWSRPLFLTHTGARRAAATLRGADIELFDDVARSLDLLADRSDQERGDGTAQHDEQ